MPTSTPNLQMSAIPYSVRVSSRARRMRIAVNCDMSVVVTVPVGFKEAWAERFVKQKSFWILKSLNYFKKFEGRVFFKTSRLDYAKNRAAALSLAKLKVAQWAAFYGFGYNRVSVKNQKTRWGSCSKKGNLNFNYKIVNLPPELLDYLVVHEVCHLRELNHGPRFWALVSRAVPNYKALRRQLREFAVLK